MTNKFLEKLYDLRNKFFVDQIHNPYKNIKVDISELKITDSGQVIYK